MTTSLSWTPTAPSRVASGPSSLTDHQVQTLISAQRIDSDRIVELALAAPYQTLRYATEAGFAVEFFNPEIDPELRVIWRAVEVHFRHFPLGPDRFDNQSRLAKLCRRALMAAGFWTETESGSADWTDARLARAVQADLDVDGVEIVHIVLRLRAIAGFLKEAA